MPSLPSTAMATRKRTRSTNVTESNVDHQQATTAAPLIALNTMPTAVAPSANVASRLTNTTGAHAPPKRQRNNPPSTGQPPPVAPRTNYSLRNRSLTPDPRRPLSRFPSVSTPSTSRQRYNLRNRRPQSQVHLPQVPANQPTVAPRRLRHPIPPIAQTTPSAPANATQSVSVLTSPRILPPPPPAPLLPPPPPSVPTPPSVILPTPPAIQPRQYRLVYISDEDDEPSRRSHGTTAAVNTTSFDFRTNAGDNLSARTQASHRRLSRSTSGTGFNTRSRTATVIPSSASSSSSSTSTIDTDEFYNGVAHIRLNRAIEIVIDSIQSLEGAVSNFDQLVFGLIYGRLGTRAEAENIETMIRLSRILNLNLTPRLSQEDIDSLPKIIFVNKTGPAASIQLAEKCPICLTEFDDQETINKLHCTHLFHLQCISTWLSENDSCPTCRRKVMGD